MSDNPLFPIAVGGFAALGYYLYREATCECHARKQSASQRQSSNNGRQHPLDHPFLDLKDYVNQNKFQVDQLRLLRVEKGIHNSTKYIWVTPSGQYVISYRPISRNIL